MEPQSREISNECYLLSKFSKDFNKISLNPEGISGKGMKFLSFYFEKNLL